MKIICQHMTEIMKTRSSTRYDTSTRNMFPKNTYRIFEQKNIRIKLPIHVIQVPFYQNRKMINRDFVRQRASHIFSCAHFPSYNQKLTDTGLPSSQLRMINYDYAGHFAHDHSLYLPRSLERASALASTIHDSVIPPFYVGIREPTHNNGSNACRSPLFRTGMSERLHLRYRIAT